jgi:nucleoside-diphosphate-sugar epimerase
VLVGERTPKRIVVTGGAGFIGRAVVRQLVGRGDQVVVLVRDPVAAREHVPPAAELVRCDLATIGAIEPSLVEADGVIHLAGSYRIGIPVSERPAMLDANVGATERVLDAAIAAGVARVIVVSTVNVFGNTRGQVVDETYRRDPAGGFVSYYDETKWLAHVAAEQRIAAGAPIVIVQPGTTYGPGDHTPLGQQLQSAYAGTAPYVALGDAGISPAHVQDVADGVVAALDAGRVGESYILAGQNMRLREAMAISARAGGHRPPRLVIPAWVLRVGTKLGPNLGGLFGLSPNLREILQASDGVTYWATSAKAAAELGYRPRDPASGFADAYGGASADPWAS